MQTWPKLLSADEARRIFAEHYQPRPTPEEVPTPAALGRVTAEAIRSPADLPPFRRSLMDGFAVRAADLAQAPVALRVVDDIRMGQPATRAVGPGEAARVPTGGMLPEGADCVVPVELATGEGDRVTVQEALAVGRHVIGRGEDVHEGEPLLGAGHRLRAPDIGALMGLGITQVSVTRRPQVAILATGDELVPPEESPPFGKIRDMNSYSLAVSVQALGGLAERGGIIPDELETLHAAASAALARSDVLILSAGSSVGERDHVAAVIDRLGRPGILVHGVNIRPGKPTVFAVCAGKPVFGLPGQPVSVLNTFDLFVAPLLRQLLGLAPEAPTTRAHLACEVRSADGREDHVRVTLATRGDGLWAEPVLGASAMISTMVRAQGIIVIPAGSPGLDAGQEVTVRLIG